MNLLHQTYAATVLVTLTLFLQSAGMAVLIEWLKAKFPSGIRHRGVFRSILLVVRFTSLLIWLHMLQILLWSSFYRWKCFPSWESAFYFSVASYSTVGAGDLSLEQAWRIMGPLESVTGVLMCGLSVSFLFAIVTRLVEREDPDLVPGAPAYAGSAPFVVTNAPQLEASTLTEAVVARH
jgi:voltage-gated potassium channel